jgi:phage-related tail protein
MKGTKMDIAKNIKALEFKLQYMVLMMNADRMEEANESLQSAFALISELKTLVQVVQAASEKLDAQVNSTVEASSLKLEAV